MLEIAIVEDEKDAYQTLTSYLEKCKDEFDIEFNIKWYTDAVTFLNKYSKSCQLVFMDIDLPGLNGMDATKRLREIDEQVCVVFVTNLAQYAVNGYAVSAFDFIVKPLSYSDFYMKFKRVMSSFALKTSKSLWVVTRNGKFRIEADQITYVEVMKHEISYNMANGKKITFSGTLKKVQEELKGLPFVLCNRCYLVNLTYIKEVRGDNVYIGNDVLQISLSKKKDFLKSLNKYLSDGGN